MKKPRSSTWKLSAANAAEDQALHCCHNIETVAGLLEACGRTTGDEPLPARLAANAGSMIAEETVRLRRLLSHGHAGSPRGFCLWH